MDNKQILGQMIKFNKTIFDNAFKAMQMAQDQGEKMINSLVEQATWLPEDGRKTITDWIKAYQKGCTDFKENVDQQYQKVEDFFSKS
jgi:polyhydroxyalkanoate synthesis regulator phasin